MVIFLIFQTFGKKSILYFYNQKYIENDEKELKNK